jgi:16S rRNA (adenine1518-N6/adenine1519-N6)-dimethyltransferase
LVIGIYPDQCLKFENINMHSVHSLLRKYGIRPKKRLGQHFLCQPATIRKIVLAIAPSGADTIIEIGAGLGLMTGLIAERAGRVIALERDASLIGIARAELGEFHNIEWVEGDVLDARIESLAGGAAGGGARVKVTGNLPYNISSPILLWLIEQRAHISQAVVMLQREVAERVCAGPGGKDYGRLSVMVQASAVARRLFDVPPSCFVPPPEVRSSVVRLDFESARPLPAALERRLSALVRAAFGKRRKTIRNALAGAGGLFPGAGALDAALASAGIEPGRRPETLSVEEFMGLAEKLGVD